jgi:hypothetical protein
MNSTINNFLISLPASISARLPNLQRQKGRKSKEDINVLFKKAIRELSTQTGTEGLVIQMKEYQMTIQQEVASTVALLRSTPALPPIAKRAPSERSIPLTITRGIQRSPSSSSLTSERSELPSAERSSGLPTTGNGESLFHRSQMLHTSKLPPLAPKKPLRS